MKIRQYQVDAFTGTTFSGNPAAVCPLDNWLDDRLLQAIADENNLSETAFFVPRGDGFALRWFTPTTEIDLCGHATLASAHVLFNHLGYAGQRIAFATRSGELVVERAGRQLAMDFPARPPRHCPAPPALLAGLGGSPTAILAADDYIAVFDDEATVRDLTPDFACFMRLDRRGVVVTAPGSDVDFVSRFFAPKVGVAEDPVTGSAHCELTPYWADRLGKTTLSARQVSRRGGEIDCRLRGDRVMLAGQAVTFLQGEIELTP